MTDTMFDLNRMAMTSFMNSKVICNRGVKGNWIGANDVFDDDFDWTSFRSRPKTPASPRGDGDIEQCNPQNEWTQGHESDDASAVHGSTKNMCHLPPRPQRPFTEYNVFFRLERELLLQDKSNASDDLGARDAAKKILSSGKDIESPQVAALRPPRYRHLVLSTDWYVVGNKYKCVSTTSSDNSTDSSTITTTRRRGSTKKKGAHGKISFLELTKLISGKWREVCQNDPVTKEFCKKIARSEAARYKEELGRYRSKYGVDAAKGKKRKPRKSLSPETQKKTKKQEGEEIDMLNDFVPVEGDFEDDTFISPLTSRKKFPFNVVDFAGIGPMESPDIRNMYARQQEIQAQLMQQRMRRTSPSMGAPLNNTFQGIRKNVSQAQTFQGSIIPPDGSFDRYAQGRKMLDNYQSLQVQELSNNTCSVRQNTGQSFFRQNSAFDSKYDFLNTIDDNVDDEFKVREFLQEYESKNFQQLVSETSEDTLRFGLGIDRIMYLNKFHRKCMKQSRLSPSQVSQFNLANSNKSENSFMSNSATTVRQYDDWALFHEHVVIKDDDDDITKIFQFRV